MSRSNMLTYSIKQTPYYFSENARLLFQVANLEKDPFDPEGTNLSICLLSLNRVHLTIKLLSSIEYYIPGFKGEILIIDNNSSKDQITLLKDFISTCPLSIRLEELKENLGVGRARNHAAGLTNKEWIMFLDNDMFFLKNPLPAIKKTFEHLGVHFLNLPLINYDNKTIFALGGGLFTWPTEGKYFAGGGSCFNFKRDVEFSEMEIGEPFLSDFLFGGASVLNRKDFINIGGFDHNMFVGFEDIDFSLRLYNKGYKIGNIDEFVVVHNHKPSNNSDDIEAEKKRFSNEVIKASAEAFEKKNGMIVYDRHTEEWLKQKQDELIKSPASASREQTSSGKKRIALVVDVKDWAFHNIAKTIESKLSHKYEFTIYFQAEYAWEKWLDIYPILYKERFDMIMFFWRPVYQHLYSFNLKNYLEFKFNISEKEFQDFLNDTILLTTVYDHLYLDEAGIKKHADVFSNNIDGYFVSSNKLKDIYDNIEGYRKPYCVIQDGVDLNKFYKKNIPFSASPSPLVVGWAGNSAWGIAEDGIDHKGFNSIIKPAIKELKEEGYAIELIYADKQEPSTHIHPSQMNDFFNKLDVYICTSDIEGTPNPVLESMACGIAVISTDVGIVKEAFGKKQRNYILEQRTKECLKEKLKILINDRSILSELSKENSIRIKDWTWDNKCERFEELFDYYFHRKSIGKLHHKKFPFNNEMVGEIEARHPVDALHPENGNQPQNNGSGNIVKATNGKKEFTSYWHEDIIGIKEWYHYEYDVLPLWFKRLGHIVKAFQGHRSFGSLINKKQKKA